MKNVYFAGGGTGGHIYPAIAVADEIVRREPRCNITFFCSSRPIDARILSKTNYRFMPLAVESFGGFKNPYRIVTFFKSLSAAQKKVKQTLALDDGQNAIVSVGGFASAPVVLAGKKMGTPIGMLNIDAVPGKANRYLARFAKDIFVQFEGTGEKFGSAKNRVCISGSPLRSAFFADRGNVTIPGLSANKKTLLITGASGGAANINNVIGYLLDRICGFAGQWQIVHLTGIAHFDSVRAMYKNTSIKHVILDYFDDMASLLSAADLVIARAGAMSIAEFAASATPAICMPYPYHGDRHQRLNAEYLVSCGCGKIVEDLCDVEKTAQQLWPVLAEWMSEPQKLITAAANCSKLVRPDAAKVIAEKILSYSG